MDTLFVVNCGRYEYAGSDFPFPQFPSSCEGCRWNQDPYLSAVNCRHAGGYIHHPKTIVITDKRGEDPNSIIDVDGVSDELLRIAEDLEDASDQAANITDPEDFDDYWPQIRDSIESAYEELAAISRGLKKLGGGVSNGQSKSAGADPAAR